MTGDDLTRSDALVAALDTITARGADAVRFGVLVEGETGSGKTRFTEDLVARARQKDVLALFVRATRNATPPPFGMALGLLSEVASLLGAHSGMRSAIEDIRRSPLDKVGALIGLAFDRVVESLETQVPMLLAIDDLADVDDDSAALLLGTLRRGGTRRLGLLGTCRRPGPAVRPAVQRVLDWLDEEAGAVRIRLGPLTRGEMADSVTALLGWPPDEHLLDEMTTLTRGNAFLVEQVTKGWRETDAIELDKRAAHLRPPAPTFPQQRRDRIIARMLDGDADDRALADATCLLKAVGADRIDLLAAMTGRSSARMAAALDRLVERRVLAEVAGGAYDFAHPVLRAALEAAVGPGGRWRMQREAVEWLFTRADSPGNTFELADLVAEVATPSDERAITQLVQAADLARDSAPRSAVRWYGKALDLMPHDHLSRPLVLGRLSRALFVSGELSEALEKGRAALADLPPGADQLRSQHLVAEAIIAEAMETLSEEGIEFLRSEMRKRPDDVRLLAAGAHVLARAGRVSEAERLMAPVRKLQDRVDIDDVAIGRVHLARANSLLARYADMLDDLKAAAALVEAAGFRSQLVVYSYISFILAEHGAPRASETIAKATELLGRTHWDLWEAELELARILDDYRAGSWDAALNRVKVVVPRFEAASSLSRLSVARSVEVAILANRGDWTAARRRADEWLLPQTGQELHTWSRSAVDILTGEADAATRALEAGIERAAMPRARQLLVSRLAQAHLAAGRLDAAAATARELVDAAPLDVASLHVLDGWSAYGAATADPTVLHEVVRAAAERRAPLVEGAARLELGALGIDAEANLRAAYEAFHRLGAHPWRRRTATCLRSLGLKVPRHHDPASPTLTDSELQVARLVQQGSRNREIADALCMSIKTVEAYLTRIYAKLGCTSRLELARRLDELAQ